MSWRRSHLLASFCVPCLVVLCATAGGFARADDPPPDPAEVARLIRQLSDVSFPKREQASRRLAEMGEAALDALSEAAEKSDPDVRLRIYVVMRAIRGRLYGAARQLDGHTDIVVCVAISPDGRTIASGGSDRVIRLWDLESGKEVRRLAGHRAAVWGLAFARDGKRLLSASIDKTLRLWDLTTGQEEWRFEGHTAAVRCIALLPDGKHAVSGAYDNTLRLWDLQGPVSPNGKTVLSCGSVKDNSVRLWDMQTGKEVRRFEGHKGAVMSVAFTPDGRHALSGAYDKTVRIWEVATGKEVRRFEGHKDGVATLAVSADGKRVLSAGRDHVVRLWELDSCKELFAGEGHTELVLQVALTSDGRRGVSGARDKSVRVWQFPTKKRP